MRAECLPFDQIPHTTRLFLDFLSNASSVRPFYPRSPRFHDWFNDEAKALRYEPGRREQVSRILQRQNQGWEASAKTLENIARLRSGALAVVTGQQVGLFGGPAFSLYKALTAIKLAEDATRGGIETVPIFWLATTDHDLAEVNHVSVPGASGMPIRLRTSTEGLPDAPVGTVTFGPEIQPVVEEAIRLLGESEATEWLLQCYRPGETMGSAFARLFTRQFGEWGLILLDPNDPELSRLAEPIFTAAAERADALNEALLSRGKALDGAGYHQQVKVTTTSSLLFTSRDGARVPIQRRANGNAPADFAVGHENIPKEELLRRISAAPHHFSANALLRPVMQDFLLPTLAYVGGPAEVAYFAQSAVVYEALLGRITPVIPRFSATLVEHKPGVLLGRYRLSIADMFHPPEDVREHLAAHALPQDLQQAFDQAKATLEKSVGNIRGELKGLDSTLLGAADRAASKMQYQLEKLRSRSARAEVRRSEVLARHAATLSDAFYPNKTLQEREIGGIYFASRYGTALLRQVYETFQTDCLDHQVIELA